jgi:hypothetical protein
MLALDQIQVVQVELTTKCNARCPMCVRNFRGYDYNSGYPDAELTFDQFLHIFRPAFLKQLAQRDYFADNFWHHRYGSMGFIFNGNLGDFAAARDGYKIVKYIVDHGIEVRINTNGSVRHPDWWRSLALPGVTIGFDLDGLDDTHHLYRQDTNWHQIIKNAQAFIAAGGRAIWRFVPFDHNRHQESACRNLAQELGFAEFENIYDGRDTGPVYSRNGTFSHHIGSGHGAEVPVHDLLKTHITWFDKKNIKLNSDNQPLQLQCNHLMNKEIYVSADGSVYPCCYLGFYPNTMLHPGNEQLKLLIQENNALTYDLEHCVQWFNRVEKSWAKESIAAGRLYACVNSCGQS